MELEDSRRSIVYPKKKPERSYVSEGRHIVDSALSSIVRETEMSYHTHSAIPIQRRKSCDLHPKVKSIPSLG